MKRSCIKFKQSLENFDGALFTPYMDHIDECPACRDYIKKEYPELQFAYLRKNSLSPSVKDRLKVDLVRARKTWFANVTKVAAALVLLVGISSYMLYISVERKTPVAKHALTDREEAKSPEPETIMARAGLKERGKSAGLRIEDDKSYPLISKAGGSSREYFIDRTPDGQRIVIFRVKSDIDL